MSQGTVYEALKSGPKTALELSQILDIGKTTVCINLQRLRECGDVITTKVENRKHTYELKK